ncbi:50S ribosomal protein L13 [Candidatus Hodgkinia cicadicola]|uniref:50S ribosomal protein L13 n=1 Tax=Candidatus Hodgkinia cicadicola TaxID=573658 RepID=A0ABX4MHB7_9HYPH|nr:50S ribosomal protein L13 [Candidatus Hodgkinia cicadicola]
MCLTISPNHCCTKWYIIDCYNKSIGRMASRLSVLLKRINNNDAYHASKLVLVNVNGLKIGCNLLIKRYWRHTGYPGGIKFKYGRSFSIPMLIKVILLKMLNKTILDRNILEDLLIVEDLERINHIKSIQYIDV